MPLRRIVVPVVALLLHALPAWSQEHHHPPSTPPESVGRVAFPTSCRPAAQPAFERGVALLHSFWYEQARRAFQQAAAADPACAMAQWGVAMSHLHPIWQAPTPAERAEGLAAAERAAALAPPTPRERAHVDAILAYWRASASGPHLDGLRAWETATGEVRRTDPADDEAAVFHALATIAVANALPMDTAYARERRAAELLEPIFARRPEHPGLAHYLIHTYDSPALAERGLSAARRYAALAPAVPHARHMPSHTFTRLGLWEESSAANRSSADAGRGYEAERRLTAAWDQKLHALDYLVYARLQVGDEAEAERVGREVAAVERVEPAVSLAAGYALAAVPARLALERGRWCEAKALPLRPSAGFRAMEGITRFARAVGAARCGDVAAAKAEVDALAALKAELAAAGQGYWAGHVEVQRLAASAWLAHAQGHAQAALRLAREAAEAEEATEKHPVTPGPVVPARELEGELLLELGRPREALASFEATLRRERNRTRSLIGAARAAAQSGDADAARRYRQAVPEPLRAATDAAPPATRGR